MYNEKVKELFISHPTYCDFELSLQPDSPEIVRRFRATIRPDAGKTRVFYGRAGDPHLQWAKEMTHGFSTQPSIMARQLLNPQPNSLFRQRCFDKKENIYASHQRAPLGQSHDQTPGLPQRLNPTKFTFGIQTEKGRFQERLAYLIHHSLI